MAATFEQHLERLEEVLLCLRGAGLKLKPSKCEMLQRRVRYLGHIVGEDGISTDPEKVQAVKEWESPKQLKELQAFLSTVGYYRQYIANFATIAHPLSRLTSKGVTWS